MSTPSIASTGEGTPAQHSDVRTIGLIGLAQGIFSPRQPEITLLQPGGGYAQFSQVVRCQINDILVTPRVVISKVRRSFVPQDPPRDESALRQGVVIGIGFIVSGGSRAVIRVLQIDHAGDPVEHGKEQVVASQLLAVDLGVGIIQCVLGCPEFIRPGSEYLE